MRARWLDPVVLAGASSLTLAGIVVAVVVGWHALVPTHTSNGTDGNLIASVFEQSDGAAWSWVQTPAERPIDPLKRDTVVLRFWISTTDPSTASFLLSGPIVDSLRTCYGAGTHWDEEPVTFDALTTAQREAAISFYEYAPSQGLLDADLEDQVMSNAAAKEAARSAQYVRITSASTTPDNRTYSPGSDPDVTVEARRFDFTCGFNPEAFWSMQQEQRTFTFPTVTQSAVFASEENYHFANRQVSFERRAGFTVTALSGQPDYSSSSTTDFKANWSAWNQSGRSTLVLNQFIAVFSDVSDDNDHQTQLLVVGGALALVGALALPLGRRYLDLLTSLIQRLARRIRGAKS